MATIAGCIVVNGSVKFIRPQPHNNFQLKLSDKKSYMVGIDQSSSCTGLAFVSTDYEVCVLLDVRRDYHQRDSFYSVLLQVLSRVIRGQKIALVVRECPVPSYQYTKQILTELAGRIDAWVGILPELQSAEYGKLMPQSWKKYVVSQERAEENGQTFKKRSGSKSCVSFDVAQFFPATMEYRALHFSEDYDSFDALGIL